MMNHSLLCNKQNVTRWQLFILHGPLWIVDLLTWLRSSFVCQSLDYFVTHTHTQTHKAHTHTHKAHTKHIHSTNTKHTQSTHKQSTHKAQPHKAHKEHTYTHTHTHAHLGLDEKLSTRHVLMTNSDTFADTRRGQRPRHVRCFFGKTAHSR